MKHDAVLPVCRRLITAASDQYTFDIRSINIHQYTLSLSRRRANIPSVHAAAICLFIHCVSSILLILSQEKGLSFSSAIT